MRIFVGHPYRLLADSLACVLSTEFEVYGAYQTIEEMVGNARHTAPEAIVISGLMIAHGSYEEVAAFKEINPTTGIVVVSQAPTSEELMRLLDAGVSGYVTIDSTPAQLKDAIWRAQQGEVVLCGIDRKSLSGRSADVVVGTEKPFPVEGLTPREREVLNLLSQGFSNRKIAEDLFLSEHTVRTHVQNLRAKLNVKSKFEAAMLAMRSSGSLATAGSLQPSMHF